MIDFKLDRLGDISFQENLVEYPRLRIDFGVSEGFPRLKVDFHTVDRMPKNNGLKINFVMEDKKMKHGNTYVPCVRENGEKAQSAAIRLKTELDELDRYYEDFGSELIRIRHEDLKNTGNHDIAKEYTSNAISDIIPTDRQDIEIKRKITETGKLQLATLGIKIAEKPYDTLYEYEF